MTSLSNDLDHKLDLDPVKRLTLGAIERARGVCEAGGEVFGGGLCEIGTCQTDKKEHTLFRIIIKSHKKVVVKHIVYPQNKANHDK